MAVSATTTVCPCALQGNVQRRVASPSAETFASDACNGARGMCCRRYILSREPGECQEVAGRWTHTYTHRQRLNWPPFSTVCRLALLHTCSSSAKEQQPLPLNRSFPPSSSFFTSLLFLNRFEPQGEKGSFRKCTVGFVKEERAVF